MDYYEATVQADSTRQHQKNDFLAVNFLKSYDINTSLKFV